MEPCGVSYCQGLFHELFWCMMYTNRYCMLCVQATWAVATATIFTRVNPLVRSAELT